jgi:hypothetical protein
LFHRDFLASEKAKSQIITPSFYILLIFWGCGILHHLFFDEGKIMISSKETLREKYNQLKEGGEHSCFIEASIDLYNGPMKIEEDIVKFIEVPKGEDITSYVSKEQFRLADTFGECTVFTNELINLDEDFDEQIKKPRRLGLAPLINMG